MSERVNRHISRLRVVIRGAVQGVGFRPFVYRLATQMGFAGWVSNTSQGVFIEVEGEQPSLEEFLLRLERERPPRAFIQSFESSYLPVHGFEGFEIRHSEESGQKSVLVLPDVATCPDCLREMRDPCDRRYRYPFTNCTNCGPRYTIIEALPYDRANTTMRHFPMCERCQAEYDNPLDRRFHAQPNACPVCGPHLELWDAEGNVLVERDAALGEAAEAVRSGKIVALKGLGGFHLLVDARNEQAVRRLRLRKHREEKPFALMYPDAERVKCDCQLSEMEERLLLSPECPIVLLARRSEGESEIAPSVAPRNPHLGVLVPYTPLHWLLLDELGFPVVATSGNLSDEPICTDECEALQRLASIADVFLVHNRPIARHVDDSVARVSMGRELVLRRARGYAPLPVRLAEPLPALLAVGAHQKNAVGIAVGRDVFLSQHIGDLDTALSREAFGRAIESLGSLYEFRPEAVACDEHPNYASTQYARALEVPQLAVQHHYAHVVSCMAENELRGQVLGVAWDGTGYGLDGTIWGGEFLLASEEGFSRLGHLRAFRLPGGEKAVKQPRRTALGALVEAFGGQAAELAELPTLRAFEDAERRVLVQMIARGLNSPWTSSAGRLFDACASIAGLCQEVNFEGQGAMELEFAAHRGACEESYPFSLREHEAGPRAQEWREGEAPELSQILVVDWAPLLGALIDDVRAKRRVERIAARFHNTLAEVIVAVARRAGGEKVVLSGGCFQNRYLTERSVARLQSEGFSPYWHQRVPPNDGGIALGQAVAAGRKVAAQAVGVKKG